MPLPKCLENIVILCFEKRFSKENSVIRLKSNILPPKFLGWLRHCCLAENVTIIQSLSMLCVCPIPRAGDLPLPKHLSLAREK